MVAGFANAVPCGVNANTSPAATMPAGSAGAPVGFGVMTTSVLVVRAPAGITTLALPLVTVPPAEPMPLGGGGGAGAGAGGAGGPPPPPSPESPPPPQAARAEMSSAQVTARAVKSM